MLMSVCAAFRASRPWRRRRWLAAVSTCRCPCRRYAPIPPHNAPLILIHPAIVQHSSVWQVRGDPEERIPRSQGNSGEMGRGGLPALCLRRREEHRSCRTDERAQRAQELYLILDVISAPRCCLPYSHCTYFGLQFTYAAGVIHVRGSWNPRTAFWGPPYRHVGRCSSVYGGERQCV